MDEQKNTNWSVIDIGERLFSWRDYTPIVLIVILFLIAQPTVFSSTLGTLLLVVGEAIRLYSVAFIGPVSRTRSDSLGESLMTKGPYAVVRNPIYVGNFFITMGFAIFGGVVWFAVLTLLLFAFQYYCIVQYEEKLLTEKFGDEFRAYKEAVPAWFPRSWPRETIWVWPNPVSTVFRSEKRTFAAIFAVLILLIIRAR